MALLTSLLGLVLAPQGGIFAVDTQAVGAFDQGKWAWMPSMFHEGANVPRDTVERIAKGPCFVLSPNGTAKESSGTLYFDNDERDPAWKVMGEAEKSRFVWFGAKPAALKVNSISTTSPTYLKVAVDYLKTKKIKNPKPVLNSVHQVDLDGDGTMEVLIVMASRKIDDLKMGFTIQFKSPDDYCAAIVRSVSGSKTVVHEIDFYRNSAPSGAGAVRVLGIWNLDGRPGAEIAWQWDAYESAAMYLGQFAKGKHKTIALVGTGA
ncbi:MAG TPA: hypothetical protein PKY51_12235 [Fimbriimonadaceae bacterium]|nr:hypothetical protein [Fimbriimonadaceae bacterium]